MNAVGLFAILAILKTTVAFNSSSENGQHQSSFIRWKNHSLLAENFNFGLEEVSRLSRGFVDFLSTFEDPILVGDAQDCVETIRHLALAYLQGDQHALEWYDSWGKIPSGLHYGNGASFGNYEQCRNYRWQHIRGQHCTFAALLPNDLPVLRSSICVPDICAPKTTEDLYGSYLLSQGLTLLETKDPDKVCVQDRSIEFNAGVVVAIALFSIIGTLVLMSTGYEISMKLLYRKANPVLAAFAIHSNIRSVLQIAAQPKKESKQRNTIECVYGIRALSMIWIIVVHVHETGLEIPVDNATARVMHMASFFSSAIWLTGYFAVDTFLALGGMLAAMSILRELDKRRTINLPMLYLHRYIRITAPLAALVLMSVSFIKYIGEGVMWKAVIDPTQEVCLKYWWSVLLHIQNYVNTENMCHVHTWYLSADMQLYLIAPALVYPLWRYGKRIIWGIASLALLSMACVLTTFLVNEFRMSDFAARGVLTYYPTHARMSVWLWGLIFGYFLHYNKNKKVDLPSHYLGLGWSLCFAILALTIFSFHKVFNSDPATFSYIADAFFESISRSAFAACVLWIIFVCSNGNGGIVNEILSAAMWQPLAKLSFVMYLLHLPILQIASLVTVNTVLHFSFADLLYRIWGAIGLTATVALFWSALFEIPFVTLDKLLLNQ
ncbi:nose resistant to fluoxetine protein 6-like [Uranotaenia lowii]|uniref:nose resistant to fluoxetine protein 6-like n=1 Tax=Uranotaenia lowii TaxID=190385 RepID=UPI00247B1047|nr:nose resistant to fluoxetine protein 6-like [Uranotaenia lowii]